MTRRKAIVSLWVLVGGAFCALGIAGSLAVVMVLRAARAQEEPVTLSVFSAPSHVPAGENWVLVGSMEGDLPEDVAVSAAASGITVLEVRAITKRALGVRVHLDAGTAGDLLKVNSPSAINEVLLRLSAGSAVPALSEAANFTDQDFSNGSLPVGGLELVYAYFPATDVPLGALRIHNRSTGLWHFHEHAKAKAEKAAQEAQKAPNTDPAFVDVDEYETLPDTDGDGIFDFDEAPEEKLLLADQLGVVLASGSNILDLVAVDEAGNASWTNLEVMSMSAPAPGG